MSHEVHNPYVEEIDPNQRFLLSRRSCWLVITLFLAFILVPPIYRNIHELSKGDAGWVPVIDIFKYTPSDETPTLAHHLKASETKIDAAEFRDPPRRFIQTALTKFLDGGNQKTYVGKDGYLYLKAGIDSLTGYGPLKPEPPSPMKDPTQVAWQSGLPVITAFAAQLKERGIDLLLVPIPIKPMIYPEQIDGKSHTAPLRHRDAEEFYAQLRAAGIDVLDLSDELFAQKKAGQVFLKQDTHWTSDAMKKAARLVADHIKSKPYFAEIAAGKTYEEKTLTRTHFGDLVEKLDLAASGIYQPESQNMTLVLDPETGQPVANAPLSPITLLGDSFVNIYDDPAIGFADPTWTKQSETDIEPLIGAGFRRHLAKELGTPLDVIANNGGGATSVRQGFADKPDNIVRSKKLVVWTIAARDLFLSETPARKAAVVWENVEFNTETKNLDTAPANGFIATATLIDKAPIADPNTVTYKDCIYSCLYKVEKIENGKYTDSEILVWQWAFKDKIILPEGRFEIGKTYRLNLSPWDDNPSLHTTQLARKDEVDGRFDLTPFYAEKAEPAE